MGVWGGGRVLSVFRFMSVHGRSRSRTPAKWPMHCAVVIGVYPGRVGVVMCHCAMGIGEARVVSNALCHCDWRRSGLSGASLVLLCRGDW